MILFVFYFSAIIFPPYLVDLFIFYKTTFQLQQKQLDLIYQLPRLFNIQFSMGLLNAIKAIIYKSDLLNSGSLLRVKGEPQHSTLLGGLISITLMIVLAAAFSNKIIATFDKLIITSSTAASNADDPLPFNISTLDNGPFMFGVEVWHHDLNGDVRYFDISLANSVYNYGTPQNTSQSYALEPCTREHWNGYPLIQSNYDKLDIKYWMCLPKNKSFQIKAKYSSAQSKTLDVSVKKCTNNSLDSRPCASQADIDLMFTNNGTLFFTIYFLNPLINPDSQTYLSHYLEDSNYITFSRNGGEESRLFIQDYTISTDQSIFPNNDIVTESGGIVVGNGLKSTYSQIDETYAVFFFFKSPISTVYNRSFQKLDEVFSYMGGLFGTILIAFFLISSYNTYKYQISLAGYLYFNQSKSQKMEKKYNFIYYLGQLLYTLLKLLNISPNWQRLGYYYQTRQEILKQLDILLLLKRINFLEKSLTFLFTEHQLKGLYLSSHLTMPQAAHLRRSYRLKSKLKAEILNTKRYQHKQVQQQNSGESHFQNELIQNYNPIPRKGSDKSFREDQRVVEHDFNSDRYSSQSSSDEENHCLLQSMKQLRAQQNQSKVSKRIWESMDQRLQSMIKPHVFEQKQNEVEVLSEDKEITNHNLQQKKLDQSNNLLFLQPEGYNSVHEDSQHQFNPTLAKVMFSKLKAVHAQSQIKVNQN